MNQSNIVLNIAVEAHKGQFRKDGITPYINHVVSVMSHSTINTDDSKAIAAGHDLFEDTKITKNDLIIAGVYDHIIEAIGVLTKKKGEKYLDYLEKVKSNPLARKVKIADMISNLADDPSERQIRKYAVGLEYLTK